MTHFSPLRAAVLVACVGLATGALTLIGQKFMPGEWNTLVNSGAVWLVPAFLVGSRMPTRRWAAGAGLGTLLATLLGYYVPALLRGTAESLYFIALWACAAFVAGPLYGLAGSWWRADRRSLRVASLALLGGVLVAEGSYLVWGLRYHASGWSMIAAGVLAALLLARSGRDRLYTALALPLAVGAALAAYGVIAWLSVLPAR